MGGSRRFQGLPVTEPVDVAGMLSTADSDSAPAGQATPGAAAMPGVCTTSTAPRPDVQATPGAAAMPSVCTTSTAPRPDRPPPPSTEAPAASPASGVQGAKAKSAKGKDKDAGAGKRGRSWTFWECVAACIAGLNTEPAYPDSHLDFRNDIYHKEFLGAAKQLERELKWEVIPAGRRTTLTPEEVATERCILAKDSRKRWVSKVKQQWDNIVSVCKNQILPLLDKILSRNGETRMDALPSGMDLDACKAALAKAWWGSPDRQGYQPGQRDMPDDWSDVFLDCFVMFGPNVIGGRNEAQFLSDPREMDRRMQQVPCSRTRVRAAQVENSRATATADTSAAIALQQEQRAPVSMAGNNSLRV